MVVDCFPFLNELDLLELRLHELSPLVDKFVLSEATLTFSNKVYDGEMCNVFGMYYPTDGGTCAAKEPLTTRSSKSLPRRCMCGCA